MSEEEAKKRRDWQNGVYEMHLKCKDAVSMNLLGRRMEIPQGVFSPPPYEHNLLAKAVLREVKESDRVLDMGTGSGVQAIFAASKSTDVTAVDVNPSAVECARANVELNNLYSRVTVKESDLFENVEGQYDLIIFDPPFRWFEPRDVWEKCNADKDYATLRLFFENAEKHLSKGGRMLIHFGTSGDLAYLRHLIRKAGFKRHQVLKESRAGWTYFVYRVIPQ
jgi:release factor glutamine methyltransferase